MIHKKLRVTAALGAAVAALFSTAAIAVADAPNDTGNATQAALAAYHNAYPQISDAAAQKAVAQQEARKSLYQTLANDSSSFGGAWFEPLSGVLNVAVTNKQAGDRASQLAAAKGITLQTHLVKRSFASLQSEANTLRGGDTALARAANDQVGIDVKTNKVVVALSRGELNSFGASNTPSSVKLTADPQLKTQADAGCTSRAACDWTIRAGAMIWVGSVGNNDCSVGFTARNSVGRFVYTAGHCSTGNGVTWGTGGIAIGPMWASINSGDLDASIIKVTNGWFTGDTGGEIYHDAVAGKSLPVNGVAPTLGYIWSGDSVCLSANFTSPNGPNYCGVVGTNSDASVRGMVRVDGLDACPGDSGGGWYWLTSSNTRIAYGLHSRSDDGCHGSNGGSHSWFSALPEIKSKWTPSLNVETR